MISMDYIAGFLDADGFVSFKVRKPSGWHKTTRLYPLIGFTGCNLSVLETIREFIGPEGSYIGKTGKKQEHHRQAWQLVWAHRSALEIGQTLRPSVQLKGQQIDLQQEWSKIPQPKICWAEFKARMHELNAKGE